MTGAPILIEINGSVTYHVGEATFRIARAPTLKAVGAAVGRTMTALASVWSANNHDERTCMPNIGSVLKEEISRLARRELRSQVEGMRKASAQYRRHIAALKRQVAKLESQVSLLQGKVLNHVAAAPDDASGKRVRFVPKALRSQRERLGLSAADYGRLMGVSAQSVYNWEREAARPRGEQILRLAALRAMGKREARARLEQLDRQSTRKSPRKTRKP
jgi:DNA-binding transcriptional regulator YiaG